MNVISWGGTVSTLIDLIFPVGAIYTTTSSSFDPNSTFGGTWTKITNKFLVGAGDTYTVTATGGSSTRSVTLSTANLPSHSHANTISVSATQASHKHGALVYTGNTRQSISNTYAPNSNSDNLSNYWGIVGTGAENSVNLSDSTSASTSSQQYSTGYAYYGKNGSSGTNTKQIITSATPTITVSSSITNASTGSGSAFTFDILPPYEAVYMWERTK